jgi:charged multivesicular body protein 1
MLLFPLFSSPLPQVTKNMSAIVKSLEKSVESNNLEKIATTMNQFEKQFENLDLQTQVGKWWSQGVI